ncbi:hypothetical protein Patl1_07738 [Pistacia atlantica]|uniref:Uncharacterized protein n=1 Tax=Pistacia atlantica TaxID=434234 RepID=A0ACC1AJN7_9ROSI|nr:hypothetical protein Patl1_07738 [Pistacia atlantica]
MLKLLKLNPSLFFEFTTLLVMELLLCLSSSLVLVSNPAEPPTIPMVKKVNSGKSSSGLRGKFIKLWLAMWLFWNTLVDVIMFLATALMLIKDTKTPLKGPLGVGSSTRRFVHRSVSLDDIKLIKNSTRTAGLSRYLNRKYGESNKIGKGSSERSNNLPMSIRLRATFFMNFRPIPGIQELADMVKKGTKAKWGNQIGYLIYPFKIALRDNPLDHLLKLRQPWMGKRLL